MISVLPCELNEDDTFEGTESGEISMDTLEMVNYEQCSSCVMEIETAIATSVREVETGTNPDCGTEITENLQDSLIEAKMEIPFMRKSVKSQLAQALEKSVQSSGENQQAMHVLDCGAPIHKVKWQKKVTYKDIAVQYVNYVRTRYRDCCIVFDGYGQGPTIKDHKHQRRIGKTCAENIKAHSDQQTFLSNEKNKSQFIALLNRCLEADGQILHNSTGDADTLIVETAVLFARQEREREV
ncbi:hypothetical protein AC249_AIPGENE778 [Paramuricea clavata]|uniref:Uncharacterized protein n=1 Tax=Paramuricea clavata TaxID=317549 RepID=A0A6S7JDD2_PARCT|nr:hypothetical protein AC249_AIPGENE778 [Paramuricea clavata]